MSGIKFSSLPGPVIGAFYILASFNVYAGSCCGGGSGANILLSKMANLNIDSSVSWENYNGYWNKDGDWKEDPKGSELNQYRLSLGSAYRFGDNWQGSISIPYVANRNKYASGGLESNTSGLGDTSINLWYEAFDSAMCVYKVRELSDLKPAIYWGLGLTVPTGISPYDDVNDNFDITGRGFYRLDGKVIIDKTIYPWTGAINLGYGIHFKRPVNRDYGTYVDPYDKKLGDRASVSFSVGYVYFTEALNELTTTVGVSYLREGKTTIDDKEDPSSGMKKIGTSLGVAWTTPEKDMTIKGSWNHAIQQDGWGESFPTTNVMSLGVAYVFY
jgi:hypothetical protein